MGTHATVNTGFGIDKKIGIGESPWIQYFQTVFQMRPFLLLLSQGMLFIERAFFHNLPETVYKFLFLFLIQIQRQLKIGILLNHIKHFRERNIGRTNPGTIITAGTDQESQGFLPGDFLPPG